MKIFKISIFFFVLLLARQAGAVCYEATGFGTTDANGIYTEVSSDKFVNDNGFYYLGCAYQSVGIWQYVCINSPDNRDGADYYHKNTTWPYTGSGFTIGDLGGSPGGTISETTCPAPPDPGTPTSTLPSWIGLPWLIGNATSTQISTTTQTYEISYSVNTTTQEMFNALTDHTQSNLAYGLGIFLIVAGGFLWTLRSRK